MSYWYDSKARALSSNENSNPRPLNSKDLNEIPNHSRQPLGERNVGRSRSPISQNLPKSHGSVYNQSQIKIENQYLTPLNENSSNMRRGQARSESRRDNGSLKGELLTPSPSPSRSPPRKHYDYRTNPEFDENQPQMSRQSFPEDFDAAEPGEIQEGYEEMADTYPSLGMQSFPQQRGRIPNQRFGNMFQTPNVGYPFNRNMRPIIKKPPQSVAADWTCSGCHNINFAKRISCNICQMPKPYFEILKTPISQLGPQGLFKDTDWQCFNCRNVNFQKRISCNICGEPKPEEYTIREMTNNIPKPKKNKKKKKKKSATAGQMPGFPMNTQGISKIGNSIFQRDSGRMQGQFPPQFQQKRYENFQGSQNISNRVPFNQRPVQRSRSRSFMKF